MKKIKTPSKKVSLITLALFLAIAGVGGYYLKYVRPDSSKIATTDEGINLSPPTDEDSKRVEDNKQRIVNQDEQLKNQSQQNTSGKKSVTPTITYAGQYGAAVEVGAYVSGIFEDSGKCTATFTKSGSSFSRTVAGVKNVNSVNCPAMTAAVGEFPTKGTWSVVVSYSSDTASGSSEAKQIEVK